MRNLPTSSVPILVNSDLKQLLEIAIKENKPAFVADLLSSELLLPQLFLAIKSLSVLSMKAGYEVYHSEMVPRSRQSLAVSHHGLDMDAYVHFTSPLHRYVDVVTHR